MALYQPQDLIWMAQIDPEPIICADRTIEDQWPAMHPPLETASKRSIRTDGQDSITLRGHSRPSLRDPLSQFNV